MVLDLLIPERVLIIVGEDSHSTDAYQRTGVVEVFQAEGANVVVVLAALAEYASTDFAENVNPNRVGHSAVADSYLMARLLLVLRLGRHRHECTGDQYCC